MIINKVANYRIVYYWCFVYSDLFCFAFKTSKTLISFRLKKERRGHLG